MSGTRINGLQLLKVIDGDTVKVELDGKPESLRLICLDTEESLAGSSKPVTAAGKAASHFAKTFFGVDADSGLPAEGADVRVDIEFDTDAPLPVAKQKHRGNYGRLICYVYKDGVNYNLHAVAIGWSPYFVKYGRSRLYHDDFEQAESAAQAAGTGVWDPTINAGGPHRDYDQLIAWWHYRSSAIEDYRRFGIQRGAKSVRLDYGDIVAAAQAESPLTVFCDLQGGIGRSVGDGAVIYAGSPAQPFKLWIPDRHSDSGQALLRLIATRYAGYGRSYVYASGTAKLYPAGTGKPEIVLSAPAQLHDRPDAP